ncbi:hypothetical protein VOLCADRAFT_103245 [Volvox carteri f. nagariensis]|uniref:rRNA adenine N(6)-methyltransferase n=1 Tax=Volvox carteri f. nagariensis TaxID=3068 RepID=D8TKG8_VOLCA|nr:uncharacterized protein VOLCADRAFT_103245 [Volvox carteri f. nagariensis]EFJ52243.1 hypothetical protein VOLCADRAFT_103245 [Volvox carteri f. nagariensis]|eukprot:XP_002947017.1 hypothetical protein VOLCADRAFT_103245 [Volvox carteri f. nagariensis]
MRLRAARRLPGSSGSGSGSSPTKGGLRSQPKSSRKSVAPLNPALSQNQTPKSDTEDPVEVPSVGWMWQVGGSGGGSNTPITATATSRPMPSAISTVANLYEDRIKAKKSLGQNFLTDDAVLQDIVAAAGVGPQDLVLEVGPGTGNLTKHLLASGAGVTAVEKDDTLYGRLQKEYGDVPRLTLIHGDALKVGLEDIIRGMMLQQDRQDPAASSESVSSAESALASTSTSGASSRGYKPGSSAAAGGRKVKVVANLPYNITKDLLTLLLPLGDWISDLHIMIQHEAAVRLTEHTPGGPEWRAANIRTLFYCRPRHGGGWAGRGRSRYRFRISRLKYDPVPGVDGALVTFSLIPPSARPAVPSERAFHSLVVKAFSERRKKMRNSLQPLYGAEQVEAALSECGLNADSRAQDLSLEQFVAFSRQLHSMSVQEGMGLLAGAAGGGGDQYMMKVFFQKPPPIRCSHKP